MSWDEIVRLASEAEPLRSIVDPDHNDFLKPGDIPARVRAYCELTGQPITETRGQVVRCLLEGLALRYRVTLESLEKLMGKNGDGGNRRHRLDTIHIVGGGTQNKLLSQLTADATQRRVITGPIEATAIGNLLVQAIALGQIGSLEDAREVVRRSFEVNEFEPNPAACQAWDDAYAKLGELMQ